MVAETLLPIFHQALRYAAWATDVWNQYISQNHGSGLYILGNSKRWAATMDGSWTWLRFTSSTAVCHEFDREGGVAARLGWWRALPSPWDPCTRLDGELANALSRHSIPFLIVSHPTIRVSFLLQNSGFPWVCQYLVHGWPHTRYMTLPWRSEIKYKMHCYIDKKIVLLLIFRVLVVS